MESGLHIPSEIQNYEKKVYDQRQLIELSKALNSQLDLTDLIDSILNTCLAQVQTLNAGILLKDTANSEVLTLHSEFKGFEIVDPSLFHVDIYSPLIEYFTRSQRALTWETLEKNKKFGEETEILRDLDLTLLVPLLAKGEVNGIIVLGSKATGAPYPTDEISFLEDLASLAGIAANNARLYQLATTDMMTNLKIHHFFQSKLREERNKAVKRAKPLSLLFTDIDHFKKFNDTYGHQTGDKVLIEVSKLLSERARKVDTAARYGGEEFCLIMPQTTANQAYKIAEKIRKAVEINSVSNGNNEPLKVTISIGIAQLDPEADKTNEDLIEKADKALYRAKRGGRNQCQIYDEEIDGE